MSGGDGLKSAVEGIVDTSQPPVEEPQQLDMLGLPVVPESRAVAIVRRGPGRPPGAKNKRTEEWAQYLLGRYGSPLEVLAQLMSRGVDEIRAAVGCDALEALHVKVKAATELAPYIHGKQPVAVEIDKRLVVQLVVNEEPAQRADAVADALVATVIDVQENQGVSDGQPDEV